MVDIRMKIYDRKPLFQCCNGSKDEQPWFPSLFVYIYKQLWHPTNTYLVMAKLFNNFNYIAFINGYEGA